MDAELDLHYEQDGIPLNLLEIREQNYLPPPTRVRIVRGHQWSGDFNTTMVHLGVEELSVDAMIRYHLNWIDIDMRNDWLTNHYFPGHPNRSEYCSLTYEDPRLPRSLDLSCLLRPKTSRKEDLYWTINQTEIWVGSPLSRQCLALHFETVTPNFDHFYIRIDDATVSQSAVQKYNWPLHEGENALSVQAVNKFGIKGIPSTIRLCLRSHATNRETFAVSSLRPLK